LQMTSAVLLKIALVAMMVLALSSVAVGQTCAALAGQGAADGSGDCCCFSGYAGSDCSSSVGATCLANAPIPTEFSTAGVTADLTSVSYVADHLELQISSSVVQNRRCTAVHLGGVSNTNPECAAFIKNIDADACADTWTGSISWSDCLNKCDFAVDPTNTDDSVLVYTGLVEVNYNDTVDAGGDFRTENMVFTVRVTFPAVLSASIDQVQVVADFSMAAVLSAQSYDAVEAEASLTFKTTVPWPYRLSSAAMIAPSNFQQVSFVEGDATGCPADSGVCVQYWTLLEDPLVNTCDLGGRYNISYATICRSAADCPFGAGVTPPASLSALISSGSFCGVSSTNVVVTSTLQSVLEAGSATQQTTFQQNHIAYFTFVATSAQAQIQSLVLTFVNITEAGTLFSGSTPTTLGQSLSFLKSNVVTDANVMPFQFLVDPGTFNIAGNYEVIAIVDVYFTANDNAPAKRSVEFKRSLEFSQSSMMSALISVQPGDLKSTKTSGATVAHPSSTAALLIAMLACALFSKWL